LKISIYEKRTRNYEGIKNLMTRFLHHDEQSKEKIFLNYIKLLKDSERKKISMINTKVKFDQTL